MSDKRYAINGPATGRVIYLLSDPRNMAPRYVGKADQLKRRVQNHLCPHNLRRKRHVARWLAGLIAAGLKPVVTVLEAMDADGDWEAAERKWIAQLKSQGADLCNLTDGGEGGATYGRKGKSWSELHRQRYRQSRLGKPIAKPSEEIKRKRGEAIAASWAAKRAAGIFKRGPVHTDEAKRRIGDARRGKPLTAEHKRKLSEAKRGVRQSPEHIAARAIGLKRSAKVRVVSEETKAKLRAAWVRRKQRIEKGGIDVEVVQHQ